MAEENSAVLAALAAADPLNGEALHMLRDPPLAAHEAVRGRRIAGEVRDYLYRYMIRHGDTVRLPPAAPWDGRTFEEAAGLVTLEEAADAARAGRHPLVVVFTYWYTRRVEARRYAARM